MKKFILSIIWVIGCYFSAMSQDVSGAYDLETAVQIALENNLSLKRSELNQLSNEATLLQNKGSRYPSFQTGASSGYRWGRSINPVTNLFETQ
ncbi:MAG TPA: transporter, partial [Algoriphagus sp.]